MSRELESSIYLFHNPIDRVEAEVKASNKEELEKAFLRLLEEAKITERLYIDALRRIYQN